MTPTVVHRVHDRVLRSRARHGAADSAAPCDLQVPGDGPAPGAVPVSHRHRGSCQNFPTDPVPVPAPVRDRVTCRFADGGAESAPPCSPHVQALRNTCRRGPGDSPGPCSRCRCRGGTARFGRSRAIGGREVMHSTVRVVGADVNRRFLLGIGNSEVVEDSTRQRKTTGDNQRGRFCRPRLTMRSAGRGCPSKTHHRQDDRHRDDRRQPVEWRRRQPADLRVDRVNRS